MKPERALKNKIRQHLRSLGCYVYCPVPVGMGEAPLDIYACWAREPFRGRMLVIEAKTPGNKPTPRQAATAAEIEKAGGITFWCDSFDSYLMNMGLKGLLPARG